MAHRVLAIIRRRLLACLTILSLLLCLATLALWERSYSWADSLYYCSSDASGIEVFGLWSTVGELTGFTIHYPHAYWGAAEVWQFRTSHSSPDHTIARFTKDFPKGRVVHLLGFGIAHSPAPGGTTRIVAPQWFIALLFATLPAIKLRSILRTRRRHRVGLCHHCGYDLRATPPDARCPECGETRQKDEGVSG